MALEHKKRITFATAISFLFVGVCFYLVGTYALLSPPYKPPYPLVTEYSVNIVTAGILFALLSFSMIYRLKPSIEEKQRLLKNMTLALLLVGICSYGIGIYVAITPWYESCGFNISNCNPREPLWASRSLILSLTGSGLVFLSGLFSRNWLSIIGILVLVMWMLAPLFLIWLLSGLAAG